MLVPGRELAECLMGSGEATTIMCPTRKHSPLCSIQLWLRIKEGFGARYCAQRPCSQLAAEVCSSAVLYLFSVFTTLNEGVFAV